MSIRSNGQFCAYGQARRIAAKVVRRVVLVLLENSGRLLGKDFLLSSVWSDVEVEENSLARAIADIRRALGEGPKENRFIATVARRGYRFVANVTTLTTPSEAGRPQRGSCGVVRRLRANHHLWLFYLSLG